MKRRGKAPSRAAGRRRLKRQRRVAALAFYSTHFPVWAGIDAARVAAEGMCT